MSYVDGFVLPVPEKNLDAYTKMARDAGEVWREHGALAFVECVADDLPDGETTDFKRSVKLEDGETVIFAWIVYDSREHRDRVLEKVMADPRIKDAMDPAAMPFDGKRMFWGGFKAIVEL